MLMQHGVEHCMAWLLMVDGYLRPSEALRLRRSQFIMPATGQPFMSRVAIHLNPRELRVRSKTGELDESVVVSRAWLSDALVLWIAHKPDGPAFQVTLLGLRTAFLSVAAQLGLTKFKPVLYMGRHSGASIDRPEERLELDEVKKRGRWRTDSSVRRYEKRALVQKVLAEMSVAEVRMCARAAAQLQAALRRRCS